jgi:hypothetical protein
LDWITGYLHHSSAIAEINKNNTPMIPTTIHPTKQGDSLTNMA